MYVRSTHLAAAVPLFSLVALAVCGEQGERAAVRRPALEFPEAGVDDPAAYEGYATRFFRDSHGNAVQIYLNQRDGRVVHVWANAANESAAFTLRDAEGRPAPVRWGDPGAVVDSAGSTRSLGHRLAIDAGETEIGWFLLGTMRQERDFQYFEWHLRPYDDPPFVLRELTDLIANLERLPELWRERHLRLLNAEDIEDLRGRLEPSVTLTEDHAGWTVLVEHVSLDGRNRLTLQLRGSAETTSARLVDGRVVVAGLADGPIELDVTVATDSEPLTPLGRDRLFNDEFEAYFARRQVTADSVRGALPADEAAGDPRVLAFRRLERQALGLELLSYREKLMASLPNYATYFGRDQMMSALMLEPVSSVDLQEGVIASVIGKIDPSGQVSHEEALGGQAIREAAAEYNRRIEAWAEAREGDPDAAAEHVARAGEVLEDPQAVRENYHMVDDDFQLAVLVDRYLARGDVTDGRKRAFLTEAPGYGPSRLQRLARNLAFMTELARPYVERPVPTNLVGFFRRDERGWLPGSWRDSRPGYGSGRFAMDVNVVWVPEALAALERIARATQALGLSLEEEAAGLTVEAPALTRYLTDPPTLRAAIETWRGARRHFEIRLEPPEVRRALDAWLGTQPAAERDYWQRHVDEAEAAATPLSFLAVALDEAGRPLAVVNTDPATELFLVDHTAAILGGAADASTLLATLDTFERPYPVGLFVAGLGPVVANETFAGAAVRAGFRESLYHSPRVVWGREVNLLLLGLALRIDAAYDDEDRLRADDGEVRAYVEALRRVLGKTREAVDASGLSHNELWSYRIEDGALQPVRYGVSSDIQLWNVTDLAVGFLLDRLPSP